MPMNSKHHGHGKQGVTPKRAANLLWRGGHQSATAARVDQRAMGVIGVKSGDKARRCRSPKAESELTVHRTQRQHVKLFLGNFTFANLGLWPTLNMHLLI